MGRWIRNSLVILSLLLCVVAAVLWGRSYGHTDTWQRLAPHYKRPTAGTMTGLTISSARGRLLTQAEYFEGSLAPGLPAAASGFSSRPVMPWERPERWEPGTRHLGTDWWVTHTLGGFVSRTWDGTMGTYHTHGRIVGLPFWFLTGLFAAAPALAAARLLRRLRRWLRPPLGHCPVCGYDLRATPGRCPECGRPVSAARHGRSDAGPHDDQDHPWPIPRP